ncbi:MAG: DNA sulfur modification protein DndB [Candidatus Odinarchaeota archaeon]
MEKKGTPNDENLELETVNRDGYRLPNACRDKDHYFFTAIRGIQAEREYYVIMCPLWLLPVIFPLPEPNPPDERAQRLFTKSRVPKIKKYIINNPESYTVSSLTVSIDGDTDFIPFSNQEEIIAKAGHLKVPVKAGFSINDGQHRVTGLILAYKEKNELRNETVPIVFYTDGGLKRSQQMFSDLNRHAIRPTRSLSILYDHRDELARFTVKLSYSIPIFKNKTEFEKTNVSSKSPYLFTLSAVYQANRKLLDKTKGFNDEDKRIAIDFWCEVTKNIIEYQQLLSNDVTCQELRDNYVHAHGVILVALGIIGHELINKYPDWKARLEKLGGIEWSRKNARSWEGRVISNDKICKGRKNIQLAVNLLKTELGIPLAEKELLIEEEYRSKHQILSKFFNNDIGPSH